MLGAGEVTVGLVESNGSLPRAYFWRLTAEDRHQLQNPTLISSVGLP